MPGLGPASVAFQGCIYHGTSPRDYTLLPAFALLPVIEAASRCPRCRCTSNIGTQEPKIVLQVSCIQWARIYLNSKPAQTSVPQYVPLRFYEVHSAKVPGATEGFRINLQSRLPGASLNSDPRTFRGSTIARTCKLLPRIVIAQGVFTRA